jgi:hypothetical protein
MKLSQERIAVAEEITVARGGFRGAGGGDRSGEHYERERW